MVTQIEAIRHQGARGAETNGVNATICRAVGDDRDVLLIGSGAAAMACALSYSNCRVVVIDNDDHFSSYDSAFCEKVLVGNIEAPGVEQELDGVRFDSVVLADMGCFHNPVAVLSLVRRHLLPGGHVVAAVPNAAHVDFRLRVLTGHTSAGIPAYTRIAAERVFNEAGYDVHLIERYLQPPALDLDVDGVSEEIVQALRNDIDAEIGYFVIQASPPYLPELELLEHRLRKLSEGWSASGQEMQDLTDTVQVQTTHIGDLRDLLEKQSMSLAYLSSEMESTVSREHGWREQMAARDGELKACEDTLQEVITAVEGNLVQFRLAHPGIHALDQDKYIAYESAIHRIRGIVDAVIPGNAKAVVVSKGDAALLQLPCKEAWHFPQDMSDGSYAGYYPATSEAAIEHLEALHACDARYIVFPWPSLWWLEHYAEFNEYLYERHRLAFHEADTCVIFELLPLSCD